MKSNDVDPGAPPDEKMCTSHIFKPIHNRLLCDIMNPGSQIQLLNAHKDPPAIIFDAVYAGAVVRHFGTQAFKDVVSTSWKPVFYPHEVMSAAEVDQKTINNARAAKKRKREDDAVARTLRREDRRMAVHASPGGPDIFDMLMFLPYAFLPKDDVQAMSRRAKEKAEAAERERLQEIVGPWARDVRDSQGDSM